MSKSSKTSLKTTVGGIILAPGDIEINDGYPITKLMVRNTGDRPIQIGSHFHFFEINPSMQFDRAQAFGMRLNIPATTAVRFEAGDEKEVTLVPYQGKRRVIGFNSLVNGWVGGESEVSKNIEKSIAMRNIAMLEFSDSPPPPKIAKHK